MALRNVFLVGFLLSATAFAQAPVPIALRNARTVFLIDESADPKALDEIAKHLMGWKRFEIVDLEDNADLIVTVQFGRVDRGGIVLPAGRAALLFPRGDDVWIVTLRDAKAGTPLYSDKEEVGFRKYSPLKRIIDRLLKRIEDR